MDTEKIRIYFLFDGKGRSGIDMSNPDKGNPGVGGTQFCFLLLAFYLTKFYSDKYEIFFISEELLILPEGIENLIVKDITKINHVIKEDSVLIVKQNGNSGYYDNLEKLRGVKIIHWAHNYMYGEMAKRVAQCHNIKANVFVGKQFYDFYIDHDIIKKSHPIFNMVPSGEPTERVIPEVPEICFIGQISKSKGIITLLKVWRKVRESIPDCRLSIIGKGNLYDRSVHLGPLEVTDERTECQMMKYIIDKDGIISPDVRFLGILGQDKYEIFAGSTVGMVNPSARTETFGMGIIEMASASLPVVTRKWNGHPDTAIDGETALLSYSVNGMASAVVRLIKDRNLNIRLGERAKERSKMFLPEAIVPKWDKLITDVHLNCFKPQKLNISRPYKNNYKFIRGVNAILRHRLGLRLLPAVVDIETYAKEIMKKVL